MVLDRILCYSCGELVMVEARHRVVGKRRGGEEAAYYEARTKNWCPLCKVSLELMASLDAGRERISKYVPHFTFKSKRKQRKSNLPYVVHQHDRDELVEHEK